jgi:biopolymer transport protein ExbD
MSYRPQHQAGGLEPRIEMTPLLDVIFLLLVFFIYALVVSVEASAITVGLQPITSGKQVTESELAVILIRSDGTLQWNDRPIAKADLPQQLQRWAARPKPPAISIAIEANSEGVDRGTVPFELIELLHRMGIDQVNFIGPKPKSSPSESR